MWRFIDGVSNPKKSTKSDQQAQKRQYQHEYEASKRARAYNKSWEEGRSWLQDSDKGMVCVVCIEFGEKSMFTTGCPSYKLDSIRKHETSKQHTWAVAKAKANEQPASQSVSAKIVQSLNKDIFDKLAFMFRTCHALLLRNRPLRDFEWQCKLDQIKGLNIGNTYTNRVKALEFSMAIADVELGEVSKEISDSKFVCLMGDGSTDAAVCEQELWFARTCTGGDVSVKYIGVHSTDKANAENITDGLKHIVVDNLKVSWFDISQKLVALGCDGASVMTGAKGGVGALLRAEQKEVITLHCMSHRLELALKDSTKGLKLYDKAINVLAMGLYYYYHNSALNRGMLRRTFAALKGDNDVNKLLLPTRVGGTRWIGHQCTALSNLTTSYRFIVAHLEQIVTTSERVSVDAKSKAKAFLSLLKNKNIVCLLLFSLDVLCLKKLSFHLQQKLCTIATLDTMIGETLRSMRRFRTNDGPHLRKAMGAATFQDVKLTHENLNEFNSARLKLIDGIEAALTKRFQDFTDQEDNISVVAATKIANIAVWPREWDLLETYGEDETAVLTDHFNSILRHAGVDTGEAEQEWATLKRHVFETYFKEVKCPSSVRALHQQFHSDCANILALMDLIMTMSPTTSEVERGFSQLKLIKTNLRSKMTQKTLSTCMAVKMLSKEIDQFDPTEAIHRWNAGSVRQRRPTLRDGSKPAYNLTIESQSHPSAASSSAPHNQDVSSPGDVEKSDEVQAEAMAVIVDERRGGCESESDHDSDYDSGLEDELEESTVFGKLLGC